MIVDPGVIRRWSSARAARQGRFVLDPAAEHGRDGHDRAAGPHREVPGGHLHAVRRLPDTVGRGGQAYGTGAEHAGQPYRELLRAAREPAFLRASGHLRQQVHRTGRADVGQDVQQRQLGRLGREDRRGQHAHDAVRIRLPAAPEPVLEGRRVPFDGVRGRPGRVRRQFRRHPLQLGEEALGALVREPPPARSIRVLPTW
nr:hypothetical protein [Actinomadura madurae]